MNGTIVVILALNRKGVSRTIGPFKDGYIAAAITEKFNFGLEEPIAFCSRLETP